MTTLEANDIQHEYETTSGILKVLAGVSFSLEDTEIATIVGRSGCGKSTLLQCLAGLMTPTSGTITLFGKRPAECLAAKEVGYAFQRTRLLPWSTILENVMLPARVGPSVIGAKEAATRAEALLGMLDMSGVESLYPHELSVGMQHRVALARSLLLRPRVLFLDEPLAGLDLLTRTEIMIQMVALFEHFACPTVIVTHSIEEAVFWGGRILILSPKPSRIASILRNQRELHDRTLSYLDSQDFHELVARCRTKLLESQTTNDRPLS